MYTLKFSVEGRKSLASLDKQVAQRILNKLKWLIQNIDSVIPLPLHGKFSGDYKRKSWRLESHLRGGSQPNDHHGS